MAEQLTLNDGTTVPGRILESGDGQIIFVYLYGMTVVQGVMLFSDMERISRIVAFNHGVEHVYTGYTCIYAASHEFGNCNLVMKKGENHGSET